MPTQVSSTVYQVLLATLCTVATPLVAQDPLLLSEALPTALENVDDIDLIDDWRTNTIVVVGTPADDKITIEVDDDRIRFWVNENRIGSIREEDLPSGTWDESTQTMGASGGGFLEIIVSGGEGNDSIFLRTDDSHGPPISLTDRVKFLLYGDRGLDFLSSEGVDGVYFIGGPGIDLLVGDGFASEYHGNDFLLTDFDRFGGNIIPDGSKDHIVPGDPESTAFRNCFLHITPVIYRNPNIKVLDKNPPKLPGVPTIASREKGDVLVPEPIVYDTILLEQDEVINEIGCYIADLNFREDGSMMPPTFVE